METLNFIELHDWHDLQVQHLACMPTRMHARLRSWTQTVYSHVQLITLLHFYLFFSLHRTAFFSSVNGYQISFRMHLQATMPYAKMKAIASSVLLLLVHAGISLEMAALCTMFLNVRHHIVRLHQTDTSLWHIIAPKAAILCASRSLQSLFKLLP